MVIVPHRMLVGLHVLHGLVVLYLLFCLLVVLRSAWLATFDGLTLVAVASLCVEGFLVFTLNNGDCPLVHVQRKLNDDRSFFSLFLPPTFAKLVVPVGGLIAIVGLVTLILRLGYSQDLGNGSEFALLLPLLEFSWWQIFLLSLLIVWVAQDVMRSFDRPAQRRPRWRTGLYGDVALSVAIASGLAVARYNVAVLPDWYDSVWLQAGLLLAGAVIIFVLEYVILYRIKGKYTAVQEMAPSNLWHCVVFPVMFYLAGMALIPVFVSLR